MTSLNASGYVNPRNPIAQSFFVEEDEGIFLTKIDLYFSRKINTAPVSLSLRPMVNGYPSNSEIIPSSVVYVNGTGVNTSTDATAVTSFTFDEPIYLEGKRDYAFCVVSPHPQFELFVAQIDEFEIGTTARRIVRNPALGSLFYSHNGNTWTAAQEQDIKFKLYRAKFDTTVEGTALLQNASIPVELLEIDPITTDSASSTITVNHFNHGLLVGDIVTLRGIDSASTIGGITGSTLLGNQTITAVDWSGYQFDCGTNATSNGTGGGDDVTAERNLPYCSVYDNTTLLLPKQTSAVSGIKRTTHRSFAGTETAYQTAIDFVDNPIGTTNSYSTAYVVANDENEDTHLSGNKSLIQRLRITTSKDNVSPIIDLQRSSMTLIDNVIDNQDSASTTGFNVPIEWVDETSSFGGSSASKHITRAVNLSQDAVGLKILFAGYRPISTGFKVYYRTATTDVDLESVNWKYLREETNNPTESLYQFREYRYLAGGPGGTLPSFNKFQIKIVFTSTNRGLVPHVKDLRVIALSV